MPLPDRASAVISHSGDIVAFEAAGADAGSQTRVWIRDRVAGTSRPVAELGSSSPGISGDGCIVAYPVSSIDDGGVSLTVVDRCAIGADGQLPIGAVVDSAPADTAPGDTVPEDTVTAPPALSFDGSTIVWSTGSEIRRYARPEVQAGHQLTHTFDVTAVAAADTVTGATVDISDDGDTVVFVAGEGATPFAPTPANVYLWTTATAETAPELLSRTAEDLPGTGDSTSPTISADGSFVVFASTSSDLAPVGALEPTAPFAVAFDRQERSIRLLVEDAADPVLSADGNHFAYRRGDAVRVLSSNTDAPDSDLDALAAVAPTGALAISQHGRWVVFAGTVELSPDEQPPDELSPDAATPAVPTIWAADLRSSDTAPVDTTTPPATTAPTTVETTSPATATAVAPTVTSTTGATTTEIAGSTTVPATTLAPTGVVENFATTAQSYPRYVFSDPPRPPARVSSSPGGSTGLPVTFTSLPFASHVVFEPTVVDAGRRTQPLMLTNAATTVATIVSVTLGPAGPFTIVADGCGGVSLTPGGSCVVDVQFAPVAVGWANALVTFQLADGSMVTAAVDGEGSGAPTLDLVPAVAGAGQTVTVFGAGFPPGAVVGFTRPGVATPGSITVDPDGTFAHVIVVLPNTPTGPVVLGVPGQPDTFGDVTAELMVSSRGARSVDVGVRGRLGASVAG